MSPELLPLDRFYPSGGGQGDFLLDTGARAAVGAALDALGCQVLDLPSGRLRLFGFSDVAGPGDVCFSGLAFEAGRLIKGPTIRRAVPEGNGEFYALDLRGTGVEVRTDPFGSQPIFLGHGLVSNRLQLIHMALGRLGLLRANASAAWANALFESNFNLQQCTFDTFVDGVRLLPAEHVLRIGCGIELVDVGPERDRLAPDAYHALVRQGAEEVVSNVEAILSAGGDTVLNLTGGRDSRAVYAAVVAVGRTDDVRLHTQERGRDVDVATGLARIFGGRYAPPPAGRWLWFDPEEELRHTLSKGFFSRLNVPPARLAPVPVADGATPFISLGGGMGEVYRAFWQGRFFPPAVERSALDPGALLTALEAGVQRPEGFKRRSLADAAFPAMLDTFGRLRGATVSERLDDHYLNFRSRFHFGARRREMNGSQMSPLMSRALRRAALGLPPEVRETGRVLFDLTRALVPPLAHSAYDKPVPDYAALPYHAPSPLDGEILPVAPARDLWSGGRADAAPAAPPGPGIADVAMADLEARLIPRLGDVPFRHLEPRFGDRLRYLGRKRPGEVVKWLYLARLLEHCHDIGSGSG